MVAQPPFTPTDGQITSLPFIPTALNGTESQEIVSPGDANEGLSYQISTATLAAFYSAFLALNRKVITEADANPYQALTTETQIFVRKATTPSATAIVLPASSTMAFATGVLVKDWAGDADVNPITITFSSSESCDGQPNVTIRNPYGWVYLVPGPGASSETGWGIIG